MGLAIGNLDMFYAVEVLICGEGKGIFRLVFLSFRFAILAVILAEFIHNLLGP